jgi:hypothetical protein
MVLEEAGIPSKPAPPPTGPAPSTGRAPDQHAPGGRVSAPG